MKYPDSHKDSAACVPLAVDLTNFMAAKLWVIKLGQIGYTNMANSVQAVYLVKKMSLDQTYVANPNLYVNSA